MTKYWGIKYWDTGAGIWISDTQIPRAGLEEFNRTEAATISFIELADGSKAKISSETKAKWQTLTLVFPKQVVTETVKNQFLSYIENEKGIRIPIPIKTGASLYQEKIIEGYITKYQEDWILDKNHNQQFIVRLDVEEFDVDGE